MKNNFVNAGRESLLSLQYSTVDEIMGLDDRSFIESAYASLLGRLPDKQGRNYYLARLRLGVSKAEILSQLKNSIEGRSSLNDVVGLDEVLEREKRGRSILSNWLKRGSRVKPVDVHLMQHLVRIEDDIVAFRELSDRRFDKIESYLDGFRISVEDSSSLQLNNARQQIGAANLRELGVKQWSFRELDNSADEAWTRRAGHAVVRERSLRLRDIFMLGDTASARLGTLVVDGHFSGSYSLASINRQIVHRLSEDFSGIELGLSPREGDPTENIWQVPGGVEEEFRLKKLVLKPVGDGNFGKSTGIRIFHHYPLVKNTKETSDLPVALFFWEESRVPEDMIATINSQYSAVVVASWFVKKVLIDSGCIRPIQIVSMPLVFNPFTKKKAGKRERLKQPHRVNLLHVSSCFPRKGIDVLLAAFNRLAAVSSEITLTIKTFPNPHNNISDLIGSLVDKQYVSRLRLVEDEFSAEQMAALYAEADVVVLPTRGEGLNMPAIEAGENSLPLVVTGFGAQTDFASANESWWLPYEFARATSHLNADGSIWVNPDVDWLVSTLAIVCSDLLENQQAVYDKAFQFHKSVNERFYSSCSSASFVSALARVAVYDVAKKATVLATPTVTVVSTWGEACGVAEYSRHIIDRLLQADTVVEVVAPVSRVEKSPPLSKELHRLSEGWHVGRALQLESTASCGRIVWIQHHFAWYELDGVLASTAESLRLQGSIPFITLHTTRPLLDFDQVRMENSALCLNVFERVFVHTIDDLNNLRRIGVHDNVILMPQGVQAALESPVKRTDATLVIGSFGFLLPHKGVFELICAFGKAVEEFPARRLELRLVNSVRGDESSKNELARCRAKISELGLDSIVQLYPEFLEDDHVRSLLSGCDLVVLPYQVTQESSSAAVRTALASCRRVATTPSSIFDEVRSATFPIRGYDIESIHKFLLQYISGLPEIVLDRVTSAREDWLLANSWASLVPRYLALFAAASADDDFHRWTQIWSIKDSLIIRMDDPKIGSFVGRRIDESIGTSGTAGYLIFGPYVPLGIGSYRLRVLGAVGAGGAGGASMDMTVGRGKRVFGTAHFADNNPGSEILTVDFELEKSSSDFEVRIVVTEASDLKVSALEITRR